MCVVFCCVKCVGNRAGEEPGWDMACYSLFGPNLHSENVFGKNDFFILLFQGVLCVWLYLRCIFFLPGVGGRKRPVQLVIRKPQ